MSIDIFDLAPAERLDRLQADREATERALEEVLPLLAAAEARLVAAQADHDAAMAAYAETRRLLDGPSHAPGVTWRPLDVDSRRAAAEREAPELAAAYEQARAALERALVERNELDSRRSAHRMMLRRIEGLVEQTEREQVRARAEQDRQRGVLERIRARVAGGSPDAA